MGIFCRLIILVSQHDIGAKVMNIKNSEAYVALHQIVSNLIQDYMSVGMLENNKGLYRFIGENPENYHDEFLDQIEESINNYGQSINASPDLIDSWLWHFPTMLGSYGYELALAHQIIFNPVFMDIGMLQFLSTIQTAVVNDASTADNLVREYYLDCVYMINNMIDNPFDESYFETNANFYHGNLTDIKDYSAYFHFMQGLVLSQIQYLPGDKAATHTFNWFYDSQLYQMDDFDASNELYEDLFEYFCDNDLLNAHMTSFMVTYCRGGMNVGNLQSVLQYIMLMSISDFMLDRNGHLKGFGIGALSYLFKLITHACVVRSEGLGTNSQIKMMLIDPVTLNNQQYKQIVQFYAGILKYYESNVVGKIDADQGYYLLQYFDSILDAYIGRENIDPPPKQSIKAKMKDIMVALKNMDKEQKTMVNRTYCQI